jgi:hypothetical protein
MKQCICYMFIAAISFFSFSEIAIVGAQVWFSYLSVLCVLLMGYV